MVSKLMAPSDGLYIQVPLKRHYGEKRVALVVLDKVYLSFRGWFLYGIVAAHLE